MKKNCAPRSIVFSLCLAWAHVYLRFESARRAHAGAVCVQMLLYCQMALGVISRGVTCVERTPLCFGVLWANQRRLNMILSSCTVRRLIN